MSPEGWAAALAPVLGAVAFAVRSAVVSASKRDDERRRAYEDARADLAKARDEYKAASTSEAACQSDLAAIRAELRAHTDDCARQIAELRGGLAELRARA